MKKRLRLSRRTDAVSSARPNDSVSFYAAWRRATATFALLGSVRIALRAIRVNRTRSALTMLGIIIGVAAVIAMVGVGSGATARIQDQIQSIGSNLIIVLPGSISTNGVRLGSGAVATLTEDDAKAIAENCPSVSVAATHCEGQRSSGVWE